jgi:uncharacterized protein with PQ loop repeat
MPNTIDSLPYSAISISIFARLIFMYLLYRNKSTNNYSLIFCILSIGSSSMWLSYGISYNDDALLYRSSTEISLLSISAIYIIKNKLFQTENKILPLTSNENK